MQLCLSLLDLIKWYICFSVKEVEDNKGVPIMKSYQNPQPPIPQFQSSGYLNLIVVAWLGHRTYHPANEDTFSGFLIIHQCSLIHKIFPSYRTGEPNRIKNENPDMKYGRHTQVADLLSLEFILCFHPLNHRNRFLIVIITHGETVQQTPVLLIQGQGPEIN